MNSLLESLHWRYAVKQYDPACRLSADDLAVLESVIRLQPSSHGLQPYKVLIITDHELRSRLRDASFGQPQITDASHLFVFAVNSQIDVADVDAHFALLCRERNVALEGSLLEHRNSVASSIARMSAERRTAWATHQAYLALGGLLAAAAQLGIDANPMEGFMPPRYDEILRLPEQGLSAVVIAGVGYRSENDRFQTFKKFRKPAEDLFIHLGS